MPAGFACAGGAAGGRGGRCFGAAAAAALPLPLRRPAGDRILHVADEGVLQRGRVARPSISFCGSSQARTLPACMSEIRSQRIPSFMKCVVTKIVTP